MFNPGRLLPVITCFVPRSKYLTLLHAPTSLAFRLLRTMADALCGPSNALQSFQKHTAVDRTLQQDRLALRQSSTQVAATDFNSSAL